MRRLPNVQTHKNQSAMVGSRAGLCASLCRRAICRAYVLITQLQLFHEMGPDPVPNLHRGVALVVR